MKWPSASLWSPAETAFCYLQGSKLGGLVIKGDDTGELADVTRALIAFTRGAQGQSLMIVVDNAL